jgi:hypothetical protein
VRRKEDLRLLTGKGRFADDFQLSGLAHAVIVADRFGRPVAGLGLGHSGKSVLE